MVKTGMNMGGEAAGSTPEAMPKLKVIRLDKKTFRDYEAQIRDLPRNALDTRESTDLSVWESEAGDLWGKYLGSTNRGEMFVAVKNDIVLAFVALKKNLHPEQGAEIEQLRFARGLHGSEHVIVEFLIEIKKSLKKEGVHDAILMTGGERHKLSSFQHAAWFAKFFKTEDTPVPEDTSEIRG